MNNEPDGLSRSLFTHLIDRNPLPTSLFIVINFTTLLKRDRNPPSFIQLFSLVYLLRRSDLRIATLPITYPLRKPFYSGLSGASPNTLPITYPSGSSIVGCDQPICRVRTAHQPLGLIPPRCRVGTAHQPLGLIPTSFVCGASCSAAAFAQPESKVAIRRWNAQRLSRSLSIRLIAPAFLQSFSLVYQ